MKCIDHGDDAGFLSSRVPQRVLMAIAVGLTLHAGSACSAEPATPTGDADELDRIFRSYFAIFPWDELPPAAEGFDLLAFQTLGKPVGEGKAQIGPALDHLGEAGSDHGGLQAAANGFDFGQFRHQPSLGFLRALT